VARAVDGLNSDGVAVVDTLGGLLSRKKHSSQEDPSSDAYAYQQRIEHDFVEKISATLDPMLGHEMYRASVSVDCDITSGEQNEETFDPTKSVMSSSQKTEDVSSGTPTAGGIPGSASNLPRPPARPGGNGATVSRRTENVAYESSHLLRKTVLPRGTIKRVSVAVLLDQRVRWEGKGSQAKAIFLPPSPDTVKAVHDIIAGVTGFTQERGDQIVVESVPFQTTADQSPPVVVPTGAQPLPKPAGWRDWVHNPAVLIGAAAGAAFVLALVVGVLFLRRKRRPGAKANLVGAKAIAAASVAPPVGGPTSAEKMQAALAERSAQQEAANMTALAGFKLPVVTTRKSEILVKELRESAKKDVSGPAQVLQTWISGNE
jgi:flagellar M-ring protein FliF